MSQPAPAWDHPAPYTLHVTVEPAHIDLMQHTNNVVYLQWMEDLAWAHSRALGLGPEEYQALGHGMAARTHELHYVQATRLGEALILGTWLTDADKLSLHRHFQFVRASDGETVFRGHTHFVCVDIAQGKVRRMPPAFQAAYGAAVAAMAAATPTAPSAAQGAGDGRTQA
jgi:acyl-CoA thioester hydrolase